MSFNATSLGGGIAGIAPVVTVPTQQGASMAAPFADASQIPRDRYTIRKAFANGYKYKGTYVMTNNFAQTPFRLAMNAGDPMSRQREGGGSNQVSGVGRMVSLATSYNGAGGGDGASGNQHYVYDSSVYTKYKRIAGKNKVYNDKSFGGSNNGAYTFTLGVRRF